MEHYYQDIDGYFDFEDCYRRAVTMAGPTARFVEVGSFVGRSTSFLAVEARNSGKAITLTAVDTWHGTLNDAGVMARAAGRDLLAEFRANVGRAGYPVEALRLPSVEAAARFDDGSLDFVLIDADHSYAAAGADIRAWLPKVKWGGVLAGDDYSWPTVAMAVADLLPASEVEHVGRNCWWWRKAEPDRGGWAVEPAADAPFLIFIPHVAGLDALAACLASFRPGDGRVVVVDQSDAGLPPGTWAGPRFVWADRPRRFTRVMNWMQRQAARRGHPFHLFMHSDAACGPQTVDRLARAAAGLNELTDPWGAVFTAYDALACYNADNAGTVGCWDESFAWYVADIDYYNRLRWGGRPARELRRHDVRHRVSGTLASLDPAARADVDADHAWAVAHYQHKWGQHWTAGDGRRHTVPYGIDPVK